MAKKKKANILTENILFIILVLAFFTILVLFLVSKTGSAAVLEEKYAKQIALIIDAAEPGMEIHLNMKDAIKKAGKANWDLNEIVSIQDNVVHVRLREKGGYSYSFFNDVSASANFDTTNNQEYFFVIG